MLRDHRVKQMEYRLTLGSAYQDQGLVFPGLFGSPFDPEHFSRGYRSIVNSIDLGHVRMHDLRHAHASELLRSGVHLKVVQERLGHADISTTANVYSHVAPTLQRDAADAYALAIKRSKMAAV